MIVDTESTRQHLEFIQSAITRMNSNSFQIKELTILVMTACFGLYLVNQELILILLISIFPTLLFWGLDAFYLQCERKCRGIYTDVIGETCFHEIKMYEMPFNEYSSKKSKKFCFWRAFFSRTLLIFYPLVMLFSIALFFILK